MTAPIADGIAINPSNGIRITESKIVENIEKINIKLSVLCKTL